jgi:hypothetical protein
MYCRKVFAAFAVVMLSIAVPEGWAAVPPVAKLPLGKELNRAWLSEYGAQIPSFAAIQVSRQLLADDPATALQWYVIALARVYYDASRCTDPSAGSGVSLLFATLTRDVVDYTRSHLADYLAAIRAAEARSDHDLFGEPYPPLLCGNGMAEMMKSLGLSQQQIGSMSKLQQTPAKPESEWPAAAISVRRLVAELEHKTADEVAHPPAVVAATPVPEAVLKGSAPERIAAIGAEALRVIAASDAKVGRYLLLQTLARAQIDAGDRAGAERSLKAAENLAEAAAPTNIYSRPNSITLFVAAGDKQAASAIVASQPRSLQRVQAWSHYGVALIEAGDLAGGRQTLDQIDSAYAAAQTASPPRSPSAVVGDPHGLALAAVGKAFAAAHDFSDADSVAARQAPGIMRVSLRGSIAAQRCKAKQFAAAQTALKTAREEAEALDHNTPQTIVATIDVIDAFAACDEVPSAIEMARKETPQRGVDLLIRVAAARMKDNDFGPAQAIDRDNAQKATAAGDLVEIARHQVARGETSDARSTIAKATRIVLQDIATVDARPHKLYELVDAQQPMASIIDVDSKLGAYEDAIAASASFDLNNRPQYLQRVVQAEVDKHADAAIKRSLPEIMPAMAQSILNEANLLTLGTTLARGGYADDARMVLRQIQTSPAGRAGNFLGGGRSEGIAGIQLALGDRPAAEATLAAAGVSGPNTLQVIATDLTLDGQLSEALQIALQLDDQHRNTVLLVLMRKQIAAGDLTGAMTATWQITNPQLRANALIELLKAMHT